MASTGRLPPVWLLGAGFLPLGAFGAIMLITVPQLLAAAHVPESKIATITTIGITPLFLSFAFAPLLDWRFARRTYAIGLALIAAACAFGALLSVGHLATLTLFLFLGNMAVALCTAAIGGWFGNLMPAEGKGALSAWFNVYNIGGNGATAALAILLLRHLPSPLGQAAAALMVMAMLPVLFVTPCPPADRRLAGESFRDFARDVISLLRRPTILMILAVFLAPSSSFALTNTLSGFGRDFHISDEMIGTLGGAGVMLAGIVGSFLVPPLTRFAPPVPLYLLVGATGAIFTTSLVLAPHGPATLGAAMVGENVFQSAAFVVSNIIILRTIGHDNPLAATQFGLLNGAQMIPLAYMQLIDGYAYGLDGPNGSFLADALISGAACAVIGGALWGLRRRVPAV
jgi:PAT family beta-lactamase induction signal transducer AmpG